MVVLVKEEESPKIKQNHMERGSDGYNEVDIINELSWFILRGYNHMGPPFPRGLISHQPPLMMGHIPLQAQL